MDAQRERDRKTTQVVPETQQAEQEPAGAADPGQDSDMTQQDHGRTKITPLEATLTLARRGRKEILPRLRQVLDESPELWRHFGNLNLQSQEAWIHLVAGKDLYLIESLRRHLDELRRELAGQGATPLDKLLIDRILACHVQTLFFAAHEANHWDAAMTRLNRYRADRQAQAHKQFLSAIKMLATIRKLIPPQIRVQMNVAAPQSCEMGCGSPHYTGIGEERYPGLSHTGTSVVPAIGQPKASEHEEVAGQPKGV